MLSSQEQAYNIHLFSCFDRNHRLEIVNSTIHDAGDYTFVPEGYTQSLCAKVHIVGTVILMIQNHP